MSILPFPSFLDDIKDKGFKKAIFEGINEVVERSTAGMNIQDIREALRGEAPTRRPNPRLQPHADGFWLHMRPSYFHKDMTGLYPEFRLGWLSTYFVFFETITGLLLMVWYTPSPTVAYGDMLNILGNVPLGQLMRDLHRLGAEFMVLIVCLHMIRTFMTASYKKPRQFTWATGVILLLFTLLLSFTGYLLPWDQLALWAVTIGASMIEAAPPAIVGENLNLLVRGGPDIGANGLLRFYLAHVLLLPAFLFIFTGVHYYKVIVHAHSLPPQKENIGEDTAKRVPLDKRVYFIPDVLTSEMMWIAVTTFLLIVLCVWFYHAPLENHADPQITPLGTTAPWYFLWVQGALKLGDKVLWGIIFPTVLLVFFLVYPYLDTSASRRYADRRFGMSLCFALVSMITFMSYMGLPEYGVSTAPSTEIIYRMRHEPTHGAMGILLPVPFDQLAPGVYTTRQFEGTEEEADEIVAALNAELDSFSFQTLDADRNPQTTPLRDFISGQLGLTHSPVVGSSLRFSTVPAASPELIAVMEEFEHELEAEGEALHNAIGIIAISDVQGTLRRADVLIVWQEVELEGSKPVLDENGEPNPLFNEDGSPMMRIEEGHTFIHRDSSYYMK